MITRFKFLTLIALLSILMLTGCLSLAEDITPPPGVELAPPLSQDMASPQTISEVNPPDQPGNPVQGASIYAEKCAPCHGETGLGDGEMAQNISGGVPEIGSFEIMRQSTPAEWYAVVSEGNPDPSRIMPAFNSLTDTQRWDVVAYAYTLSSPAALIDQGRERYLENCTECHGEDGRLGAIDFTDQKYMSELSAQSMFDTITAGQGEMPPFSDLEEDDRWALTAYLRSLSFTSPETNGEPETTMGEADGVSGSSSEIQAEAPLGEATASSGVANIRVKIVNGTAGAELPSDLEVTLRGYDNMTEAYTQTLKTNGGNEVLFENVEAPENRLYFATMEYGDVTYGSDIHNSASDGTPSDLEIVYYQSTTDPSILSVDRLHVFVDFIDENTIQIYQLYIFSNLSDQVLTPAEAGKPAISFKIPSDAMNFNVEENMSMLYMKTADGFGIINVYPDPDQYQTLFSFQLPYDKKLDLQLPIGMDAKALVVMVPDNGVKVKSDRLIEMGAQAIEGMSFNMFNGSNLSAGDMLSLEFSGRPKLDSTQVISNLGGDKTSLMVGFAGFGIALIVAGVYLWRKNRNVEGEWLDGEFEGEPFEETSEDIMDAIIALDDQYKNGELPEGAYRQRRAELKKKLWELMES